MPAQINHATGEIIVLSDAGEWEPARRARNEQTGKDLFFDGREWRDVPAPPERPTSAARGLGLGVRDVAEGLMGVPNMMLGAPQAIRNAAMSALGLPTEPTYAERTTAAVDATGLPRPETSTERRISAPVRSVAGTLPTLGAGAVLQGALRGAGEAPALAQMLVGNMGSQLVGSAAAGSAGQEAAEAGYGPAAQMGAALLGGVAGATGATGVATGGRTLHGVVQPFSEGGRRAITADILLRSSADPDGLAARIGQGVDDPSRRLSGSPVTTAQASRDPGLMLLESGMRSQASPNTPTGASPAVALRNVEAQRNASRLAALAGMQDGSDAATRGASVRGTLREAEGRRRGEVRQAYAAVDPDGTAVLPIGPVRQAFGDVMARYYGDFSGGAPADLAAAAAEVARAGDTVPWSAAQNLRSRLSQMERNAARDGDARLGGAAREVRAALDSAGARAAGEWVPAGQAVTLEDLDALAAREGAVARPDVAAALGSRAQAVPRGEKSLVQWLVDNGGVRPDGDTRQMLGGTARTRPGLLSGNAQPLDQIAIRAREAGYFPEFPNLPGHVDRLTPRDLLDAMDAELRGLQRRYPGGGAQREANAYSAASEAEVDRALAPQGLSLTDGPGRVLRAFGQDPAPAGAGVPERAVAYEGALTPEQAARWREAQAARRGLSVDFGRDTTGTAGVQQVLRGGASAPTMADASVPRALLATPQTVRQALRAAGPQAEAVKQQLRGQFIDNLFRATATSADVVDAAGNVSRALSPAGFRRFFDQNEAVARVLFDGGQMGVLRRLAADFAETSTATRTASAAGSPTAQNLSVANLIARSSNGLIDPGMPLAQMLGGLGGFMRLVYAAPEAATREMLTRAMTDPQFARMLLARASPTSVARAGHYIQTNMMDRLAIAAGDATERAALRTGVANTTQPELIQQAR